MLTSPNKAAALWQGLKAGCAGGLQAVQQGAVGIETVCWAGVLHPAPLPPQGTPRMLLGPDPTWELLGWL